MFILKSAEKILPAGGKYIQLDTLLQADGPMDKPEGTTIEPPGFSSVLSPPTE